MKKLRLAILDMYDGEPNQGMRCIRDILKRFDASYEYKVYNVRQHAEVPDLSYDVYISTGGPGSPLHGDGIWDVKYFQWLESFWNWTQNYGPYKRAFMICHSFQMACRHFNTGEVTRRRSQSFGTFPIYLTEAGEKEPVFYGLNDPFWAADFRHWQVLNNGPERFEELGASVIAIEKDRPHVDLERAIMGIRWSDALIGVQFHPEADPEGMIQHFLDPKRRRDIIKQHGQEKYFNMIDDLRNPNRIRMTYEIVLPMFLERARRALFARAVAS